MPTTAPSSSERARAWEIAHAYGNTSLARLTLLDDKLYYFSPGGSMIAYVVEGRIAMVLGDPIGPPDDVLSCIDGFKNFCNMNDWMPAFYQVLPDPSLFTGGQALAPYRLAKMVRSTYVSSRSKGKRKSIRTSVNKMKRLGYSAEVLLPPHPRSLLNELQGVSDEWLSDRKTSEMRFSVGWFDEDYLNTCPILVVRNSRGASRPSPTSSPASLRRR